MAIKCHCTAPLSGGLTHQGHRQPRLINQRLKDRSRPSDLVHVPVLIRFLMPAIDIPKPPGSSVASDSAHESRSRHSRRGPPSVIDTSVHVDTPPVLAATNEDHPPPSVDVGTNDDPAIAARPTFRGQPVDTRPTGGHGPPMAAGRFQSPPDAVPPCPLFDSATTTRTRTLTRTPTRMHPCSAEVTFGAESFEDYMCQFMCGEVKFKDFRKASIPKFDLSKNDSFVHWYKLFCSTCLQWGVWCPPYELAQEDSIHGKWWLWLPASVREKDSFMSGLIYTALTQESTFPNGSREQSAVEGCPPQAGYHVVYSLFFRLHHPLLHSVFSTASEIPRQRRTEPFSLYIRRLQDFMVRERQATRTYTESEALDLSVRNLTSEWRPEIRRLVKRDKRTGHDGALPFKLLLAQLATTFVEYASEIGRDPPSSQHATTGRTPTSIIRRIETASPDFSSSMSEVTLDDEEINLMVRAISQNQDASSFCLGCQLPGQKWRTATALSITSSPKPMPVVAQRPPPTGPCVASRNMSRSVLRTLPATDDKDNDDDDDKLVGFQQNSLRVTAAAEVDFEACFEVPSTNSISVPFADTVPALPASETIHVDDAPDPILLRRLAETYDHARHLSFAHADNGSMACTANDRELLFAYRPLSQTNVRLFDAGHHAHQPVGVGFLCVPVDNRGNAGGPSSDIYIILQPTASRGGLTFTEALIAPTAKAHVAPLPSDQVVRKLCTEHAPDTAATILDPIDGMTCDACHSPPVSNSDTLPVSPDGNARPYVFGQGMAPAGLDFVVPVNTDMDHPSHEGHHSEDLIAQRPTILDGDVQFLEFSSPVPIEEYAVRSLSCSAL
ncbi:hypothetical protein MHU86_7938 [Fragilaria crotonensis]|nr:hypothetical protein MHU86_7938 [Fragilaria crotonensis]